MLLKSDESVTQNTAGFHQSLQANDKPLDVVGGDQPPAIPKRNLKSPSERLYKIEQHYIKYHSPREPYDIVNGHLEWLIKRVKSLTMALESAEKVLSRVSDSQAKAAREVLEQE